MSNITQRFRFTIIGLITTLSLGIFVHDTSIDQAATLAVALPVAFATVDMAMFHLSAGADHTHSESNPLASAMRGIRGGMPKIQPKKDGRRFIMRRTAGKSGNPLGDYYMPL